MSYVGYALDWLVSGTMSYVGYALDWLVSGTMSNVGYALDWLVSGTMSNVGYALDWLVPAQQSSGWNPDEGKQTLRTEGLQRIITLRASLSGTFFQGCRKPVFGVCNVVSFTSAPY